MDRTTATPAEEFPDLYRRILEGVAGLELAGQRAEAFQIRSAATAAYSGPWGEAGHRRLQHLVARTDRALGCPGASPEGRLDVAGVAPARTPGERLRFSSLVRRARRVR